LIKAFEPHFGQLDSWSDFARRFNEQPVLFLLDDLGEMQSPGAQAILPGVIDTALAANGKLRVPLEYRLEVVSALGAADQYLR
jgi:hypothetical protein